MSSLNEYTAQGTYAKDINLDVISPLIALLEEAGNRNEAAWERQLNTLLPRYNGGSRVGHRDIFGGGLEYTIEHQDQSVILLFHFDSDVNYVSNVVTDFVRMYCFGGKKRGSGFLESALLRDAAVSVLRPITRRRVSGKLIHSIGVGSNRSRFDVNTGRPYSDVELTILSAVERQT